MPVCESRKCNAEILILAREPTPKGRRRFVEVNKPGVPKWVDLPGGARVMEVFDLHAPTCRDPEMKGNALK